MKVFQSVLILTLLFLSACGAAPATPAEPLETVKLKISMGRNMSYAPFYIAQEEGYFAEQGLEVEFVFLNRAGDALALLVAGEIDAYTGIMSAGVLNIISESNALKVVADRGHVARGNCTYEALLVRKDLYDSGEVTGPGDLKGQLLSINVTGNSGYFLSSYLAQAGLTLEDVELTEMNTQAEIAAFADKSIAVAAATDPDLSLMLKEGTTVILARSEEIKEYAQTGVVAFGKNLLEDRPDVGARFLAAYLKGIRQYNEGKTERNLEIMSVVTETSPEELAAACWPGIASDGQIKFEGVAGFQEWALSRDLIDQLVTEEQFWAPKPLEDAYKLLD